jgi:hypothetical protein
MSTSLTPFDAGPCLAAIAAGLRALDGQAPADGPFRLTSVVNRISGPAQPTGPDVWELRFKPQRLIPLDAELEVGAGGELRLLIDMAAPTSVLIQRDD